MNENKLIPKTLTRWANELLKKDFSSGKTSWIIFAIVLLLLLADRIITLVNFGFVYTDLDQTILWNGAVDYANGIFHEPFFYGQDYNYMLESFLAAPLLKMNIPVFYALPIITLCLSTIPYVVLAFILKKNQLHFWSILCLVFAIILPLEYNLLTTISRGFVQANLFIPFLFFPLFNPKKASNILLLYLFSALSFIANQSSILIILPIFLYVYSFHIKSLSFYFKALIVIPILLLDFFAKRFYQVHPEKVVHKLSGLKLDGSTFISSLENPTHFEYLFPFHSSLGIIYPFLFLFLIGLAWMKSKKRAFLFLLSIFVLLLISLAIPKVQTPYLNGGIFFTASRLYLYLPLLLILSLYLLFKHAKINRHMAFVLIAIGFTFFLTKNFQIKQTVKQTISSTSFPVYAINSLQQLTNNLNDICTENEVDLIICTNKRNYSYFFSNYAWFPLTQHEKNVIVSMFNIEDRRSWYYEDSKISQTILFNGFDIADSLLTHHEYIIVDSDKIIIQNNNLPTKKLLMGLNLEFGN